MDKKTILFICTHNSARSQMAEGLVNALWKDKFIAYSAGTEQTIVKPMAIAAMNDINIDISHHFSKTIDYFKGKTFDWVITVCDNAKETCPYFPGKNILHKSFVDPSNIGNTEEERLNAFIKVRNEIKDWLDTWLKSIS